MHLNFNEKIFSFVHRFIEKKYHLRKLSKILKNISFDRNSIIFDVGGNEGESIDLFLSLFKSPKIYSFEPEKKSYKKLLIKYGNIKTVKLFNFAFGNKKEVKNLRLNIKSSTSTLSKINTRSKYYNLKSLLLKTNRDNAFLGKEKVKVKKIDDFCTQKKIKTIDLLKIDTEGFELNVIKGAKKTLKKTKVLIIEFQLNDMYLNYNPKKINDFLIKNNFNLIAALKFPFMLYEDRIYIQKE